MFLSRKSHQEVVDQLQARLDAQAAQHELVTNQLQARIADLETERGFYREEFLKKVGVLFPQLVIPTTVTGDPVTINQIVERKGFRLEKSDWTQEDHQWFREHWIEPERARGMAADEADYWYYERYRDQRPIEAFCV